jgi:hypothetical protein
LLSEFSYGSVEVAEGGTTHHAPPSDRRSLLGLAVVEAEVADRGSGACELSNFNPIGARHGLPGLSDDPLHVEYRDGAMFVQELDQIVPVHPSVTAGSRSCARRPLDMPVVLDSAVETPETLPEGRRCVPVSLRAGVRIDGRERDAVSWRLLSGVEDEHAGVLTGSFRPAVGTIPTFAGCQHPAVIRYETDARLAIRAPFRSRGD